MKKVHLYIYMLIFLAVTYSCNRQGYSYSGNDYRYTQGNIGFQVFYDNLSPHGRWMNNPEFGYIWIPDAGRNFIPYSTRGHWVITDYGWTWFSDYSWGWAPFHYGRWDYDSYYGWFWVPGNEWGPSWVTWRRADGYFGWAPMRPGMNINHSITGGTRDVDRWTFVREKDFGRTDLERRYVSRRNNENIFRNSTIINNTYIDNNRNVVYASGPRPEEVQRSSGRRINRLNVRNHERPGQRLTNSELQIYRPSIRESGNSVPTEIYESDRTRISRDAPNRGMGRRNSQSEANSERKSSPKNKDIKRQSQKRVSDGQSQPRQRTRPGSKSEPEDPVSTNPQKRNEMRSEPIRDTDRRIRQ